MTPEILSNDSHFNPCTLAERLHTIPLTEEYDGIFVPGMVILLAEETFIKDNHRTPLNRMTPTSYARQLWLVNSINNSDTTGNSGLTVTALSVDRESIYPTFHNQFPLTVKRAQNQNHNAAKPTEYIKGVVDVKALEEAGFSTKGLPRWAGGEPTSDISLSEHIARQKELLR